jgi:hypothetical protein
MTKSASSCVASMRPKSAVKPGNSTGIGSGRLTIADGWIVTLLAVRAMI